jgi:hypothetical protein
MGSFLKSPFPRGFFTSVSFRLHQSRSFILTFILLMISFFAVISLQSRDRWKLFADAKSASDPSIL